MLNYVEGYARRRDKVKLNFFEIAHGSTQECKYIIYFSFCQQWITNAQYQQLLGMVDEIAKMMWATIDKLEKTIDK
jgi:four helix bundle protein